MNEMQWDFAIAEETTRQLYRVADQLDTMAYDQAVSIRELLSDWQGSERSLFDERQDRFLRQTLTLSSHLREAAHKMAAANEACRAEQSARLRLQDGRQ